MRRIGILAVLVWVGAFGPATAAGAGLTPEQVAQIRDVTSARISPGGEIIAFTLARPRQPGKDEDGPAWVELHVVRTDGTGARTFVGGDVSVSHVRFSPDGRLIAYLSKRGDDEHTAIWAIPVDGGESRKLVEHETDITSFDWSPDGTRIAFVASEPLPEEIEEQRDKGFNQEIYEEDWQPRRIYLAQLGDGDEPVTEARKLALEGQPWHVRFSPDGSKLLTDLSPTPLTDDRYMFRRLAVVDAESGEVVARIENPGKLGQFDWSPDGNTIVLVSGVDINDPREGRLMAVAASGGTPRDLLPELRNRGHVEAFAFRADGAILYLASVGVGTRVGLVGPGSSANRILYEGDGANGPVLYSIHADRAGRTVVAVGDSPRHPRELFVLPPSAPDRPQRLTDSNPWLSEVELAPQEIVTYTARDGLELQGLLIHPLRREEGRTVPLIVVAHGGPEYHYRNGWLTRYSYPGQVAAARGYAVFYPNYRGSTGRGVAFAKADQGDGGGKEFLDVIDGIEHLVARGLVDRAKVGITGGSYGGYFTALGATKFSDHFAAGVMFVGISDQLSKFGTSDIPREMELVHWLAHPFDNLELFLDRSPVMHAAKAHTPLLILHGKEDPRVNPGQSHELYRALKRKGDVPVRLVLYPGEGHGNRRAASRYDYNLRMLRWFDHFLKGGGRELPDWRIEYPLLQEEEEGDAEAKAAGAAPASAS